MFSVEVPNTAVPGVRGASRRAPVGGPQLSLDGSQTLYEVFQKAVRRNPSSPCVGWRPIDQRSGEAGTFQWLTYGQLGARAANFGSGLEALGLCPTNPDGMKLLGFLAKNRLEWNVGEQGAYAKRVVPVPMYDTLGASSIEYVVAQTELTTVATTTNLVENLFEVRAKCDNLRNILIMDEGNAQQISDLKNRASRVGIRLLTFSEVESAGAAKPALDTPPAASDVAFFCYTSGTTGDPKGALITHQGFLSVAAAVQGLGLDMSEADVHLSYLPLPHVFERAIQLAMFHGGGRIGYYQGEPLKILEDLAALRPTIFPSVPRLLNRVYDKVLAGVEEAGGVKAWLFNKALSAKIANLRDGYLTHALWDRLVFNGLKTKLGLDRVRLMVTGSAPIAPHVMDFLRAAFGCPVHEGYGQTESSTAITFTDGADFTVGHVGAPIGVNEVMLEDVPEMGYLSTDTNHNGTGCIGRGEICFRGPNVFKGYYKMPEKTASTVDADGWCHTGDIGYWTLDGKLVICDRKKNIFKLAQGEYVAAEKIENIVTRSKFIMQAFIYGDSLQSKLVAIVVVDPEYIDAWAPRAGVSGGDLAAICRDQRTQDAIMADVKVQCKEAKLKGFEIPRALHIEVEPFAVENGLLTPTFKLKRPVAKKHYRAIIDSLYAQLSGSAPPARL